MLRPVYPGLLLHVVLFCCSSTSLLEVLDLTPSEPRFPSWKSFCRYRDAPTLILSAVAPLIRISWLEIPGSNSLLLGLALLGTVLTTIPHQLHFATYPQPPKPQQPEGESS